MMGEGGDNKGKGEESSRKGYGRKQQLSAQ